MELKQRLLAMEGVKTVPARNDFKVDREAMYTIVTGDREYCVPTGGSRLSQLMSTLTLFRTREGAEAAGFAPCKTGGRLIRHARYFVLQLAESDLTGDLFRQILGRIEGSHGIRRDREPHSGAEAMRGGPKQRRCL